MNTDLYRLFFKAFSNKTRLGILAALRKSPKSVTQICQTLGLEQSRVSHNLRCLQQCGFVEVKPNGKERIYAIDKRNIAPILNGIDTHIKNYLERLKECGVVRHGSKEML
jgi:ArsR family transcriptional regulator